MEESSVCTRTTRLLQTGDMADVIFLIGCLPNQKTFKLHKLILSMTSDKFHDLFYGWMGLYLDRVEAPEIEPSGFEVMIRYIYTDKFSAENIQEATHAYLAASKYNITYVKEHCLAYIITKLRKSCEDIYFVYEKAIEFNNRQLKSQCEAIITHRCEDIMESKEFLQASPCFVQNLIQLDYLNVKNELFIFNRIIDWAEAECERKEFKKTPYNLRKVMGPLLPYIRFLCMTTKEFDNGPAVTHIFSTEEEASLTWNINFPGSHVAPLPSWCYGVTKERWYMTRQIYFCCYYGRIPKRKHICSRLIQCTIKVNKPIYFVGVSFYVQLSTIAADDLKLIVNSKGEVIGSGQNYRYNRKTKILTVCLSEPVMLNVHHSYLVKAKFIHNVFLCGSRVRRRINNLEYNMVFDVNPQLFQKKVVWEAYPHFRAFLYRYWL